VVLWSYDRVRGNMRTVYRVINAFRNVLIIAILSFIIVIGAVQIVMRYTPGINALSWVDEIMRYLNIWLIFLAASVGVRESSHLNLEYFLRKLFSEKTIYIIKKVSQVGIVISLLLLIYYGVVRVIDNLNTVIQSLPISISYFYAAIPVGSAIILLDYILILIHGEHPFSQIRSERG
jgi:TRAP-type C4-dicarboxylate transport system permease small subunit